MLSVFLRELKKNYDSFSFAAGLAMKKRNRAKYTYYKKLLLQCKDMSLEELQGLQLTKLSDILSYANVHIDYYHELFKDIGLIRKRKEKVILSDFEAINAFPFLDKSIIAKAGDHLCSDEWKKRGGYINSSGGSTGIQAEFFQDKFFGFNTSANFILARKYMGIPPATKNSALIWAAERDIGTPIVIQGKLKTIFSPILVMNSCKMQENDMRNFLNLINLKHPNYIRGYAQSIYEMAKFAKRHNLDIVQQKKIISTATTLTEEMRDLIEEVFKCDVFNFYGSREVGPIAFECTAHDGMHILMDNNIVEVVDKNGRPTPPGCIGGIIITNLNNYSMPLIRYKIGDMAVVDDNKTSCSCGCHYPKIKRIVGRTVNVFKLKNGDLVDGTYLTLVFSKINKVRQFQVIQKSYDLVEFVVNSDKKLSQEEVNSVESNMRLSMGDNCIFKWQYVAGIEAGPTGKFNYIISNIM